MKTIYRIQSALVVSSNPFPVLVVKLVVLVVVSCFVVAVRCPRLSRQIAV